VAKSTFQILNPGYLREHISIITLFIERGVQARNLNQGHKRNEGSLGVVFLLLEPPRGLQERPQLPFLIIGAIICLQLRLSVPAFGCVTML
jgi:hypothetical protein